MLNVLGTEDVFSPNSTDIIDKGFKLIRYFSWHGRHYAQDVVVRQGQLLKLRLILQLPCI
jgi:hypothetical protein